MPAKASGHRLPRIKGEQDKGEQDREVAFAAAWTSVRMLYISSGLSGGLNSCGIEEIAVNGFDTGKTSHELCFSKNRESCRLFRATFWLLGGFALGLLVFLHGLPLSLGILFCVFLLLLAGFLGLLRIFPNASVFLLGVRRHRPCQAGGEQQNSGDSFHSPLRGEDIATILTPKGAVSHRQF
jgi:hypothetical protein